MPCMAEVKLFVLVVVVVVLVVVVLDPSMGVVAKFWREGLAPVVERV